MAARGTNRERYRKGKRLAPRCDRYQCPSPNTSRQRQQPEGLLSTGSRPKGSGDDSACTQQGASAMPVRLAGGARASSHSHRQPPQRPDSAVWGRGGPRERKQQKDGAGSAGKPPLPTQLGRHVGSGGHKRSEDLPHPTPPTPSATHWNSATWPETQRLVPASGVGAAEGSVNRACPPCRSQLGLA